MTRHGGLRVWGELVYDEFLELDGVDNEHTERLRGMRRATESSDSTAALLADGRWVFAAPLPALPGLCAPDKPGAEQLLLILVKSTMGRDGDEYDGTMLYVHGDDRLFARPDQVFLTESNAGSYDPEVAERLHQAAELAALYGWFNEDQARRIALSMDAAAAAPDGVR